VIAIRVQVSAMQVDRVVKNGLVVLESGTARVSIGITGGRIAALVDADEHLSARHEEIDARAMLVLPGVVEPHCHFWDPGPTDREDWFTGTCSAAAGGVTTCIEMPLSLPPTVDEDSFRLKQERASTQAVVDYALWGGIVPDSASDLEMRLEAMDGLGAVAYKVFMCWSAREFPPVDDGLLLASLRALSARGGLLGLHAENDAIIKHQEHVLRGMGRRDPQSHVESRPEIAEIEAVSRAICLAEATGARIYIVHTSTAEAVDLMAVARSRGVAVATETAPQYLVLDSEELDRRGPFAKCSPPLRSRANVNRLWDRVLAGKVDAIGSDHAPFTFAEKEAGAEDIWLAPNGLTGIQSMLPLIYSEGVHRRGLDLNHLARLLATNAAQIFGLYPTKGAIRVGSDADLVLLDPDRDWRWDDAALLSKNRWSPYHGLPLRGMVMRTLLRGETVFQDGTVTGAAGVGRQVVPLSRARVAAAH
jgi:allantoinase